MSSSTAIGRVSESLRSLLLGEMSLTETVPVTILAPDETGGSRRINLFLYQIRENTSMRNADWHADPADPSQLLAPPLSLNLFYLMTPYAANDDSLGNASAHEILGDAMRVFAEFPTVPDTYLPEALLDASEQLKIVLDGVNIEELSNLWSTFSEPFRVSVMYEVSVVQLDGSDTRALPTRVRGFRVDAEAADPPVVEAMTPQSATAGTTVTFSGRHLDGWSAYVRLGGQLVLDAEPISGNSFDAALPKSIVPGIYQIRVDISNLHRSTFFFEVTS